MNQAFIDSAFAESQAYQPKSSAKKSIDERANAVGVMPREIAACRSDNKLDILEQLITTREASASNITNADGTSSNYVRGEQLALYIILRFSLSCHHYCTCTPIYLRRLLVHSASAFCALRTGHTSLPCETLQHPFHMHLTFHSRNI